jgi:hypothetical protein
MISTRTPEECRAVQEKLFEYGFKWKTGYQQVTTSLLGQDVTNIMINIQGPRKIAGSCHGICINDTIPSGTICRSANWVLENAERIDGAITQDMNNPPPGFRIIGLRTRELHKYQSIGVLIWNNRDNQWVTPYNDSNWEDNDFVWAVNDTTYLTPHKMIGVGNFEYTEDYLKKVLKAYIS